jgi:hypothetical protein
MTIPASFAGAMASRPSRVGRAIRVPLCDRWTTVSLSRPARRAGPSWRPSALNGASNRPGPRRAGRRRVMGPRASSYRCRRSSHPTSTHPGQTKTRNVASQTARNAVYSNTTTLAVCARTPISPGVTEPVKRAIPPTPARIATSAARRHRSRASGIEIGQAVTGFTADHHAPPWQRPLVREATSSEANTRGTEPGLTRASARLSGAEGGIRTLDRRFTKSPIEPRPAPWRPVELHGTLPRSTEKGMTRVPTRGRGRATSEAPTHRVNLERRKERKPFQTTRTRALPQPHGAW